ncbi:MAG TPA: amino acid ABC transporter permease [Acidimicrobiia bacterium]|nr:amino acid ABC transporter permease [Acidimicrobiia bacterium]
MATVTMPARARFGALIWIRKNLLSTPINVILTLVLGAVFVGAFIALVRFIVDADFTILRVNLALFVVGGFPRDQLWRVAASASVLAAMAGLVAGLVWSGTAARAREAGLPIPAASSLAQISRRFWPLGLVVAICLGLTQTPGPAIAVTGALLVGVVSNRLGRAVPFGARRWIWLLALSLPIIAYLTLTTSGIGWHQWGGLQLNLFLTMAGVLFAFPLGILLALGRRSSLPVVKGLSVTYIELIRGVPLITLLLLGVFALGFFLPLELRPSGVTRVLIAITMFEAAYIAEVVRGGFQAVPPGQTEAAASLGLSAFQSTRSIVMPQALRATIPAMVGQFISLFKDTTLVAVVGFPDVLAASGFANTQAAFNAQGLARITLPFVALVFWAGCYTMSREAKRLERRLGIGER